VYECVCHHTVVVFSVLYVAIAVALCLITGALLLFFLFPRTANISSSQPTLHPTNIYLNVSAKLLFMTVTVRFTLIWYWAGSIFIFVWHLQFYICFVNLYLKWFFYIEEWYDYAGIILGTKYQTCTAEHNHS